MNDTFKHGCNVFPLYTKVVSSVRETEIILSRVAETNPKSDVRPRRLTLLFIDIFEVSRKEILPLDVRRLLCCHKGQQSIFCKQTKRSRNVECI